MPFRTCTVLKSNIVTFKTRETKSNYLFLLIHAKMYFLLFDIRYSVTVNTKFAFNVLFRKVNCDVYVHVTRSQLELKRARCKISNKGYLSLNIFVILCHNMVIRSWDITTIPKGLSETFFGRFQQTISCDCV